MIARHCAALALLCCLFVGCGASHARHTARSSHAPAPTRSRALAFAHAVNLKATDVPGFTATPRQETETPRERELQRGLRHCAGPVAFGGAVLDEQSPSFKVKRDVLDLGVSSEVAVAPTPAAAASALRSIRGAHLQRCFSHYLTALLAGQRGGGAQLRPVTIATGTPPAPGASGSFGWRITATMVVARIHISLYVDILGFVLGPARVTLVSSGAIRPFPALVQQRLYSLLLARARASAI
jgi:hypothetical protein